jgi:aromatic-L-amino-acid decarboxylase
VAPVPFSVVCFRARPHGVAAAGLDALNQRLLDAVNGTGEVFLSHTKLDGRYCIRLAVGNATTTEADINQAWEVLNR